MTNNQLQKRMAKIYPLERAIKSTISALDNLSYFLDKLDLPKACSDAQIRRAAALVHINLELLAHYPNLNYSAEYRKIAKDTKKTYKKNTQK